jgi:small subunit ribosomal protein S2
MKKIDLREMLASAVHFGHKTSRWNPKMAKFIFGKRGGAHVFDLKKTAENLEKVCEFLTRAAKDGKNILFVSTKPQTKTSLDEFQKETKFPIVNQKWIGGLLTNLPTMLERVRRLRDLNEMFDGGEIEKFTKKERAKLKKEREKLQIRFGGIVGMNRKPDIVFVVDGKRDELALREARKLEITTVGICDSNADPDLFDYLVPANDDAISSLKYLLDDFIFPAVRAGKKQKSK